MATDIVSEWVDAPPTPNSSETVWNDRIEELIDAHPGKSGEAGPWKSWGPYAAASISRSAKNAIERMGYDLGNFELTTRTIEREDEKGKTVLDNDGEPITDVWLYGRCVTKPKA